jgi:hypothetical protein
VSAGSESRMKTLAIKDTHQLETQNATVFAKIVGLW